MVSRLDGLKVFLGIGSPCDGAEPPGHVPKWDDAIERCDASLYYFADAYIRGFEWFNSAAETRSLYEQYAPLLLRAARKKNGVIVRDYIGPERKTTGYAMLTSKNRLVVQVFGDFTGANDVYERFVDCEKTAINAGESLIMTRSRSACADQFFSCMEIIIPDLTDPGYPTKPKAEKEIIIERIDLFLTSAKNYYTQAAARERQMMYLFGMLLAIVFIALFSPLIAAGVKDVLPMINRIQFIGSLVVGTIGAVVSVLQRLTQQALIIDYEARGFVVILFGAGRVILGGLLALFVYVLLRSEIMPIQVPKDDASPLVYFFWVFAFISGFSERFAQDMIMRTEKHIAPGTRSNTR